MLLRFICRLKKFTPSNYFIIQAELESEIAPATKAPRKNKIRLEFYSLKNGK